MATMMALGTRTCCSRSRTAAAPQRSAQAPRRCVRVLASSKSAVAEFADSIGLPTDEGLFGFKPFAEVWCGRLAMMGFVTSIVQEAITGQGTLAQLGLPAPSGAMLGLLTGAATAAVVAGSASTAYKLATKKMTPKDVARYKNFLGLNNADDWMAVAKQMKARPDFATPNVDTAAIAEARARGLPADAVFALNDVEQGAAAARELKAADTSVLTLTKAEEAAQVAAAAAASKAAPRPSGPSVSLAARDDVTEALFSASSEAAYARQVELNNGRAAMLGFLAAVLVEAATGQGIILQIISAFKLSGLLGPMSGF